MAGATIGFLGKLPSNGDFIERRISPHFHDAWEAWLPRCMVESQRSLGSNWLDCYLTSPLWRFFLCEGVVGPASYGGLLVPSVDRVGRYFPLTVVVELPSDATPLGFARAASAWFLSVEQLCADAVQAQDFALADFDNALRETAVELDEQAFSPAVESFSANAPQWRWPLGSSRDLDSALGAALMPPAQNALRPMTLWWTDGADRVEPSALLIRGLPRPESFAAMLAGEWSDIHWHGDLTAAAVADQGVPADAHFHTESAGATDAGAVRSQNQDHFVVNDGNRLWGVADGMGGHRDGDVASQMVADALNAVEPTASLNALVEAMRIALDRVNADLRRSALSIEGEQMSGSTVVALAIRGAEYAVCWAGDSRAYLYRDAVLTQLTTDHKDEPAHVETEDDGDALLRLVRPSTEITRAVGAEDVFTPDCIVGTLESGDRFLLCSDGLYAALDALTLSSILQTATVVEASAALVRSACDAGAEDNVTAVVVDALAETPPG